MWTFSWEISKNFQSVIFKDVFGRYFWDGLIERQPSESISKTNDICLKLLTNYLPTSAYVIFHQKESHPPSSQLIFFFIHIQPPCQIFQLIPECFMKFLWNFAWICQILLDIFWEQSGQKNRIRCIRTWHVWVDGSRGFGCDINLGFHKIVFLINNFWYTIKDRLQISLLILRKLKRIN